MILDLLCFAEPKGIRFGLAVYRDPTDPAPTDNPNGGYVAEELERANPNYAAQLEAAR